ncbi:hypothetical protein K435DRAFT_866474 [Dendrothele bispora CBS 962.96]|uniref:Uncharacterized protein n=1 Tax=Dendrothele bispora (strain CBS 962.96) TaxID=1314807 RepID=A0A4S8LGM4_DENBC|nr:hypothetical protein K435DRAFT_866474 [Dendrothele bispora CBS 962.96]
MPKKSSTKIRGVKGWHYDEDGLRVKWLQAQMAERKRCEETNNMGSFLTVTATRFMAKFGYKATSKGVEWDIPPVPDFEDETAGAFVPNQAAKQETAVSGSNDAVKPAGPSDPTGKDIPLAVDSVTPNQANSSSVSVRPDDSNAEGADQSTSDPKKTTTVDMSAVTQTDPAPINPTPDGSTSPTHPTNNSTVESSLAPAAAVDNTAGIGVTSSSKKPTVNVGSIKGVDRQQLRSAADILGWADLSEEEVEIRRAGLANLRHTPPRLQEYFAKEARKVDHASGGALIEKLAEKSAHKDPKPQRLADVQMFMRHYFDKVIRPEYNKEKALANEEFDAWQKANPNASEKDISAHKPRGIAVRFKVAKRMLLAETEEFQQEMKELADKDYKERLEAWEDSAVDPKDPSERSAQDWGASLQKWGPQSATMLNAFGKEMGLVGINAWVGPNPYNNGHIEIFLTSAGTGPTGLTWSQFDPEAFHAFSRSFIAFGKTIYNHKARAARSISEAEKHGPTVKAWGTGDHAAIADHDSDEDSEGDEIRSEDAPSRKSGKKSSGKASGDGRVNVKKRKGVEEQERRGKRSKVVKKSKEIVSSSSEEANSDTDVSDGPANRTRGATRASKPSTAMSKAAAAVSKPSAAVSKPSAAVSKPSAVASKPSVVITKSPPKRIPPSTAKPSVVITKSPSKRIPPSTAKTAQTKSKPPTTSSSKAPSSSSKSTPVQSKALSPATKKDIPKEHGKTSGPAIEKDLPEAPKANTGGDTQPQLTDTPKANVAETTQARLAEAWVMLFRYAENPEGNMAQLHDALMGKLGGLYDAGVWNPAVQAATDEEGDCEVAMARVRKLAPAFVTFSQPGGDLPEDPMEPIADGGAEKAVGDQGDVADGEGAMEEGGIEGTMEDEDEEMIDQLADSEPANVNQQILKLAEYDDGEVASVWNHPNSNAWSPWISRVMQWFKAEMDGKEIDAEDSWVSYWEDLIEVWLDLEDAFQFKDSGEILSSKRPEVVDGWLADDGDLPGIILDWDWDETKEGMQEMQEWWEDVKPEKDDGEAEVTDWAPLDRTPGRKGFFMFISMMFALVKRHYHLKHSQAANHIRDTRGGERAQFMGDWIVLALDMKETMKKVLEAGVHIPKDKGKAKAKVLEEEPGPTGGRKRNMLEREIASLQGELEGLPKRRSKRTRDDSEQEEEPSGKRKTRSMAEAPKAPKASKTPKSKAAQGGRRQPSRR